VLNTNHNVLSPPFNWHLPSLHASLVANLMTYCYNHYNCK